MEKGKPESYAPEASTEALIRLSAEGLLKMFDAGERLFCFRGVRDGSTIVPEGLSVRYTIMALLGLNAYEQNGRHSPIDAKAILADLPARIAREKNIGDIGLFLWLTALAEPQQLMDRFQELNVEALWKQYSDSGDGRTMEVSWFLTGLCLACRFLPSEARRLFPIVRSAYKNIRRNYGGQGIFGHQGPRTGEGWIRGRIGSFADQVYPIYAFSLYGEAFCDGEAVRIAADCAKQICRLQGSMGQWWWHYDMKNGRILERYPVYAVHQHGMAPMALAAAGKAAGLDFRNPIDRGLQWLAGCNEIGKDMIDPALSVIWRGLYPKRAARYRDRAACLLQRESPADPDDFRILYECRPYCLGWLLYAFAGGA